MITTNYRTHKVIIAGFGVRRFTSMGIAFIHLKTVVCARQLLIELLFCITVAMFDDMFVRED